MTSLVFHAMLHSIVNWQALCSAFRGMRSKPREKGASYGTAKERVSLYRTHSLLTGLCFRMMYNAELDRLGCRPADLDELLAFGDTYPDEHRKYPIAALGLVLQDPDGRRCVPCLLEDAGERRVVRPVLLESVWFACWRFFAVRE